MHEYEVGDTIKIVQIDKNYGNPYVGRKGTILSIDKQDPFDCMQVEVGAFDDMANATLTLFQNEVEPV